MRMVLVIWRFNAGPTYGRATLPTLTNGANLPSDRANLLQSNRCIDESE